MSNAPKKKSEVPKSSSRKTGKQTNGTADQWVLRLYVAGQTHRSVTAFNNLKRLCETHLQESYTIEVVDLVKNPERAREDQIVAIPTLVKKIPMPLRKIIGDLSDTERTLVGLQLTPS